MPMLAFCVTLSFKRKVLTIRQSFLQILKGYLYILTKKKKNNPKLKEYPSISHSHLSKKHQCLLPPAFYNFRSFFQSIEKMSLKTLLQTYMHVKKAINHQGQAMGICFLQETHTFDEKMNRISLAQ